jgi:hypothetical protein
MLAAAALAAALGAAPYLWMLARWPDWGLAQRIAGTTGLYAGIGGVYLGSARALGVEEARRVWTRLARGSREG